MGMEINDGTLLGIFYNFLKLGKAVWKTGSYNRMDPTHYENADVWIVFTNSDPIRKVNEPGIYFVHYNDCTWGITVKVKDETGKIILDSYYSRDDHAWVRHERGNEVEVRHFLLSCVHDSDVEMRSKKPDLMQEYEDDDNMRRAEAAAGWDASP